MDEDTGRDRAFAAPKGLRRKLSGKRDRYPTKLRKAVCLPVLRSTSGTEEAIPFWENLSGCMTERAKICAPRLFLFSWNFVYEEDCSHGKENTPV